MRTREVLMFGILTATVISTTIAQTSKTDPQLAYPDAIEQTKPIETVIDYLRSKGGPGGHNLHHLAEWTLLESKPLAFEALVDNRQYVYERCLYWSKVEKKGITNWWLLVIYRQPYEALKVHWSWEIGHDPKDASDRRVPQGHPFHFAAFVKQPGTKETEQFMKDVGWSFKAESGFKFITAWCFRDFWRDAIGEFPKHDYE